jgi:hypothetical protein
MQTVRSANMSAVPPLPERESGCTKFSFARGLRKCFALGLGPRPGKREEKKEQFLRFCRLQKCNLTGIFFFEAWSVEAEPVGKEKGGKVNLIRIACASVSFLSSWSYTCTDTGHVSHCLNPSQADVA